jgi:signal peptidase I
MVNDQREKARLTPTEPLPVAAGDVPPVGTPLDTPEPADRRRAFTFARELIETILLTLVIFVAVRTLVVNFRVDGESMSPSLANGQYLLVNKAVFFHFDLNAISNILPGPDRQGKDEVYLFHPPQRGDIIVFDPPLRSDKPYVKRVIGLPGDRIAIHENKVYVNGTAIDENYISAPPHYTYPLIGDDLIVPAGSIFVLGDNRNNSSDSHVFGSVPLDNVIGKAIVSYWPPEGFGIIPHERYTGGAANP